MYISQEMINLFWTKIEFTPNHWFWKGYIHPRTNNGVFKFQDKDLAKEFNVTEVAICNIINFKRWKNI